MTNHPIDRLNQATDSLACVMDLLIRSPAETQLEFVSPDNLYALLGMICRELRLSLDLLEKAA